MERRASARLDDMVWLVYQEEHHGARHRGATSGAGSVALVDEGNVLSDDAALRRVYRPPAQLNLDKEVGYLDQHCRDFIAHSPFAVLGTTDGSGRVDTSPKGGPPGFASVLDDRRLAIPDMNGNNRIDSLRNIVRCPGVSLLFLIPGVGETLRVVGRATVSTEPSVTFKMPTASRG